MAKTTDTSSGKTVPNVGPFNSALESGLKALCVLYEGHPRFFDTQRLVFFDYLVVHSGDVSDGPESLHPPTPFRSNEWVVRRRLVTHGLRLLMERGLVEAQVSDNGILFGATEDTGAFVACLSEPYTRQLRKKARWVIKRFGQTDEDELINYFNQNLDRWGAEFELIGDWEGKL